MTGTPVARRAESNLARRTSPTCSVSDAGPPVQRQAAALLAEEMKRAGRVLYSGRPAVVWRVYFGTREADGSRASRPPGLISVDGLGRPRVPRSRQH